MRSRLEPPNSHRSNDYAQLSLDETFATPVDSTNSLTKVSRFIRHIGLCIHISRHLCRPIYKGDSSSSSIIFDSGGSHSHK